MKILSNRTVKLTKAELSVMSQSVNILRVLEALDTKTYKPLLDGMIQAVADHSPAPKGKPQGTPLFDVFDKAERPIEQSEMDDFVDDVA